MESETSVNSRNQERFQPKAVLLLSISHFIHDVYSGFLSPLLPLLIEKLYLQPGSKGQFIQTTYDSKKINLPEKSTLGQAPFK